MKKVRYVASALLLMCLCAALGSCEKNENQSDEILLTVASYKTGCPPSVREPDCYIVKREGLDWRVFDFPIHDFDYTPGYEYELRVKEVRVKNPGIDEPVRKYFCLAVLSRQKKDSDVQLRCLR